MIGFVLLALVASAAAGPPVVVTVETATLRLAVGERAELALVATIRKGFRIQANPASQPFLVPVQLELEQIDRLELGQPEYPPGEPYRLQGTTEDLSVYKDRVVIRVSVKVRPGPAAGSPDAILLAGRLRYQACNEEVCLRPSEVPVQVQVQVLPEKPQTP